MGRDGLAERGRGATPQLAVNRGEMDAAAIPDEIWDVLPDIWCFDP